jgi:uncharacterized protein (TIGR00725 family)
MKIASKNLRARLPIVGVMGSGTTSHEDRASRLGRWLAKQGVHLLTGGGGGVMTSVSKAFYEFPGRLGNVIGIIPCQENSKLPKPGYPNKWVEIPIYTHLPFSGERGTELGSRNHINILSSDVIVALPGGPGTVSELELACQYKRPVIAYLNSPDDIRAIPGQIPVHSDFGEVCKFVESILSKPDLKNKSHE